MLIAEAIRQGDWVSASQAYIRLGWNLSGDEADAVAENLRAAIEPETLLAHFEAAAEHDARDYLAQVAVPTTVMQSASTFAPMQAGERGLAEGMVREIPGAQFRLFEGRQWDWDTYPFLHDDSAPETTADSGTSDDASEISAANLSTRELVIVVDAIPPCGGGRQAIRARVTLPASSSQQRARPLLVVARAC